MKIHHIVFLHKKVIKKLDIKALISSNSLLIFTIIILICFYRFFRINFMGKTL